jgi:hypothetical protein
MNKETKQYMVAIGLLSMVCYSILITYTFLRAYVHPSYQTTVLINNFGEAHLELLGLLVTFPLGLWAVYYSCKNMFSKKI